MRLDRKGRYGTIVESSRCPATARARLLDTAGPKFPLEAGLSPEFCGFALPGYLRNDVARTLRLLRKFGV